MTEIDFSLCGSGFSSSGMNNSQDSFWVDTSDFLEPPLPQLNFSDLKITSPGSTKSTSSLDSFLHGVTNTPPGSPWKGEIVEDNYLSSTDSPIQKNADLDESVSELWEINASTECRTPIVQSPIKKTTLLGTDFLQAFGDSGAASTASMLEEQLASADNAWTATLELPSEFNVWNTSWVGSCVANAHLIRVHWRCNHNRNHEDRVHMLWSHSLDCKSWANFQ